ncbi:MAG: hypothetical protein Q4G42_05460 [Neisseria sp.]|nr:hypothetical protein [Neisseria sp.]
MMKPASPLPERLRHGQIYRSFAFVLAVCGSLLLYFGFSGDMLWAFIGVIVMFVGAVGAIVAVMMGIRDKNVHEIMLSLLLLLWLVLLPLIMMARQLNLPDAAPNTVPATSVNERAASDVNE